MGYQVIPLPTALLSTHTGGYTNMHFRDLANDMEQIKSHFQELGTSFRSIYTGFLGSTQQITTVEQFIKTFDVPDTDGQRPLILVDPVMGDDGALYSTYTPELAEGIRRLCQFAGVITPNLTEACFLTDIPYQCTSAMSETEAMKFANRLMDALQARHSCKIVITGIRLQNGSVANLCDVGDGNRAFSKQPECGHSYPGTGDIFASVLLGELLRDTPFASAVEKAAEFVAHLIKQSVQIDTPVREGVALEPELWRLACPDANL
jgi:pyridoxine kinase